ncbi:reverse transcriptase domain-containing protein [Tanacetum coccineum]|uniref:Reverse transcriptase domain-containing protein n=1 Tax=Tanacetum coccineum TaxID=301880 RepID=A0ABQ5C1D0_9ASTR
MKKVIVELPLLTTPVKEETLYVYVAAATEAVSAVLLAERKGIQSPIHYVSRTLNEAERNYVSLEKLALSLLHMSRRLRRIRGPARSASHGKKDEGLKHRRKGGLEAGSESDQRKLHGKQHQHDQISGHNKRIKLATYAFYHLIKKVLVEGLAERSTDQKEVEAIVEEEDNWMSPIIRCLANGVWPIDKDERRALRMKINQEIHMGSCEMHIGARSVVAKSIRQGYYWPTMHRHVRNVTQKCDSCQVHAPVPRRPKTLMTSIMAPWPLYQWGIDILGPLPEASGKLKFVIVAIDYFTKWIEAKPLVRITGNDVKKFMHENIVCRFGLPRIIVTDNGTQFVNDPFKGWCESLNIKQMNTAVAHPQANGLVERANKSLIKGIKAKLGRERAGWVDELPNVLWAHRTSLKQSNGETPFSLTYGSEAVIPAKIGMPTHRTMMIKEDENEVVLRLTWISFRKEEKQQQ